MRTLRDAIRMALGTLTAVPVAAPSRIDRRIAGWAMGLAPLAALPLALLAVLVVLVGELVRLPALVTATLVVAATAGGSRGLHLDGLADTADGLSAAGKPSPDARTTSLEIMRRGDVGPLGAATLVLVLIAQCAALMAAVAAGHGATAAALGILAGRGVVSACCARGVPTARPEGLGAMVAGTVPIVLAVLVALILVAAAIVAPGLPWWQGPVAVLAAYLLALTLLARCLRRFGGLTGDVLGACAETASTAALVVTAITVS